MSTLAVPLRRTIAGTFARELLSYRINRFIYLHVALMAAIGALALLAPPEAASPGAAWWVLNGVIYVASLSSLLLGLSSAQAEAEEFPMLFTQPLRIGGWVAGKCTGLAIVVVPAAALLVLPTVITAGGSLMLLGAAAAAAGVSVLWAWIGLALGLWIQDPVRGLIAALATWCVLLFGVDLLLILIGGSAWIQDHAFLWVATLMASPLDAYREMHPLTRWWLDHAALWLALCLAGWCTIVAALAVAGAERRRTRG
jgi:hypothetical protein